MSVMDVSRLLRAVVFSILVLLLAGGGFGFAYAAADGGERPAVAFPRPGDSATYSVTEFHVGPAEGSLGPATFTLTWLPEVWVASDDYRLHLAHPLLSEWKSDNAYQVRETYYDAATGEAILVSGQGKYTATVSGVDCGEAAECKFRYDFYDQSGGPCGARNALQDGQSLGKPLRVIGACDYVDGQDEMVYRHAGSERMGKYQTAKFQDADRPYFAAWYSPDLPFPVRWTSTQSDNVYYGWLGHERMYDMRLQDFTAGAGTYSRPATSIVGGGPGPVELQPRTALLFDFGGFPSPLPFPEAYAAAAADTGEFGLAGFLQEHPDAYVAEAYGNQWIDRNGSPHHAWYFIVTDGTAWQGVLVRLGPARWLDSIEPLSTWGEVVVPGSPADRVWVEEYRLSQESREARDTGRFYPPPSLLPSHLPRPADLLERQTFVENRQQDGAHYLTWAITCKTAACLEPKTLIGTGYQQTYYSGTRVVHVQGYTPGDGQEGDLAILYADADGTPVRRWAFSYDRPSYTPLGGADQSASDYQLAPPQRVQSGAVWALPDAPAAAVGFSFLALAASALYYFWPSLKGLPILGLFSRIEPDRVLDHPARKTLFALIEANPGIHFQEIGRRTGFGRGQLEHHLRKLQAADLVSRVQGSSYTCFFALGQVDRRVMAAAPLLRSDGGRTILATLQRQPGATSRQLAAQLGLSAGTVSYHVKRLRDAGLLESAGGSLHLTETGRQAGAVA